MWQVANRCLHFASLNVVYTKDLNYDVQVLEWSSKIAASWQPVMSNQNDMSEIEVAKVKIAVSKNWSLLFHFELQPTGDPSRDSQILSYTLITLNVNLEVT